jgi:hypothetical protein
VALPVPEALLDAVASPAAEAVSVAIPVAVAVPVAVSGCSCILGFLCKCSWEEDSRILPQRPTGSGHKNSAQGLLR